MANNGDAEFDDFGEIVTFSTENLSDAVPISVVERDTLCKILKDNNEDNEEVLEILNEEKMPYLFSSNDLLLLVEVTESIKTKIKMISMVGPRLIDPTAKAESIVGKFRYSVQKDTVRKILKDRQQILSSQAFSKASNGPLLAKESVLASRSGGGRGGKGRGRGGRGPGASPDNLKIINKNNSSSIPKSNSSQQFSIELVEEPLQSLNIKNSQELSDETPTKASEPGRSKSKGKSSLYYFTQFFLSYN